MIREYRTICSVSESFLCADQIQGVTCGELGEVLLPNGETCACQMLEVDGDKVLAALFDSPLGISTGTCKVRFLGYGLELPLSEDLLGRVWNSLGEPLDGGPPVLPEKYARVNAKPVNPFARERSVKLICLGGEEPLPLGEKHTFFSDVRVAQIARQAEIQGEDKALTIVISAVALPFAEREHLTDELRRRGLTAYTAVFASSPEDKPIVRLATSYTAMTAAEYFAFEKGRHVLFIEADLVAHGDAFTEAMQSASIAATNWEIPGNVGFPPTCCPYANLKALEERIGCRKGREGSITMVSILAEE